MLDWRNTPWPYSILHALVEWPNFTLPDYFCCILSPVTPMSVNFTLVPLLRFRLLCSPRKHLESLCLSVFRQSHSCEVINLKSGGRSGVVAPSLITCICYPDI